MDAHFKEIPLVDLGPMFGDDLAAKEQLASHLRDVCTKVGFFYLTGHRVPQEEIDGIFRIGKQFMELPVEQKMALHIDKHPNHYGGYLPLRSRGNALFEGYNMTVEFADDHPAVKAGMLKPCVNLWPEEFPEFKVAMSAYRQTMLALGRRLFGAFALSLGLPENHFAGIYDDPFGALRINHYPPQPPATAETDVGIFAHTDFQCFTLLAQDSVPGLQVLNDAGEWVGAPPIPGTFVINIGDMLARWSNDIFKSTPHRVLNLSGQERMSIPFFFGTDFMVTIATLPGCITPERPKKYEAVLSGHHVLSRHTAYKVGGTRDNVEPTPQPADAQV